MKDNLPKKRRNMQIGSLIILILILIGGWFYPVLGYFIILCMLAGIGIGFFKGRKWCDFCPRGSFFDVYVKPISRIKKIHSIFTNWYTRMFVMILLMSVFAIQIAKRWPDWTSIGLFFVTFLAITTVIGIILGVMIHPRTWCRFCPVGSMANLAGKNKNQLNIDSKKCTSCGICAKACPMQLNPGSHKKDTINMIAAEPDCIKCGLCVYSCPHKALAF